MRLELVRVILGIAALAIVVIGAVKVLAPFAVAILWALILGSATWPAYRWMRRAFGRWTNLAALAMTAALVLLVVIPVALLGLAMVREIEPAISALEEWSAREGELPRWVDAVPGAREQLEPWLERIRDPVTRDAWLRQAVLPAEKLVRWSRNILKQVAMVLLTIFTLFFVYRDGEQMVGETRDLLDRIAGGGALPLLLSVRETVRAVFFGWLLTAAAQGVVSMFGYWMVGLHAPVLLGIATGLAAVIPFGVGLVWIPATASLVLAGEYGPALFLAAWSVGVVSVIDNFLRPLFISGPAKVPFILVFFGVTGGLIVFGFIGLVLGPVFLAVLLVLVRRSKEVLTSPPKARPAGVAPDGVVD